MTKKNTQPEVTPSIVNPDGSPGLVSPGDMIESAWGNAVANEFPKVRNEVATEFARQRAWYAWTAATGGPFSGRADYPGLTVTVTLNPSRLYMVSAFVPNVTNNPTGVIRIYISTGPGRSILNEGLQSAEDNFLYFMTTSAAVTGVSGATQFYVQMSSNAGTCTSFNDGGNTKSYLLVEEISATYVAAT